MAINPQQVGCRTGRRPRHKLSKQGFLNAWWKLTSAPYFNHLTYIAFIYYLGQPLEIYLTPTI